MLERLREFIQRYLALILPTKLAISALVGLMAGSGVIGFFSEYAAYWFALHHGARPPLEGIPYLGRTVTLVSFLLLVLSAAIILITLWFGIAMAAQFKLALFRHSGEIANEAQKLKYREYVQNRMIPGFRALPIREVSYQALITGGIMAALGFIGTYREEGHLVWMIPIIMGAYGALAIFLAWRPLIAVWLGTIFALSFSVGALVLMFNSNYYGVFLRSIGYGGGIPVTVELTRTNAAGEKVYSAWLFLRTTTVVMLFDSQCNFIQEIPIAQISSLRHPAEALYKLPYMLPCVNRSEARVGRKPRRGVPPNE